MTASAPRVVVVGPYPPSADVTADAVLATVRALRAGGATVVVVSPQPSAAAVHADPRRWGGAVRLARAVRDAERVVWFGPEPPTRHTRWPLRRALARVPAVEHRAATAPVTARRRGLGDRLALVRAGLPTFVRSRAARARSARRS